MRKFRFILIVFLVIFICPTTTFRTNAEVVVPVGVLISDNSDSTSIINMVEFIERDVNDYMSAKGYGYVFDYICRDNEGDPDTTLSNVEYFKEQGINLIVELGDASQSQAVLSFINNEDMVLISSASSDTSLSISNDRLFRVALNDRAQALVLAEMWDSWGVEALVIMHRADLWGDGFKDELSDGLNDVGVGVLGYVRYDHNNPDVSSYVSYANNIVTGSLGTHSNSKLGLQLFSRLEAIAIQNLTTYYPILQSIVWMSTGDGGKNQAMLNEVGGLASQTRHFSAVLTLNVEHPDWEEFAVQYLENNSVYPDWNQAQMYDALFLLSNCVVYTGSSDASYVADALIPYSWTYTGLTGPLKLDVNGDRLPLLLDLWGYYEDPVSGESGFRTWGYYDGLKNEVYWHDLNLINYAGLVRPKYLENPFSSALSCSVTSPVLKIWNSQLVSCLMEPQLARTLVNIIYKKPDGSTISRAAETDENGFCFDTFTLDQAGTWEVYSHWAGDDVHAEAQSPTLTFNVDKHQSATECTSQVSSSTIGEMLLVNGSISPLIENSPVIFSITRPNGTVTERIIKTNANGYVTTSVLLDQIGVWNFSTRWEGNNAYYGSASLAVEVTVGKYSSEISLETSSSRIDPGKRVSISGSLMPAWANVPILVQFVYPDGTIENAYTQTTFLGVFRVDFTPVEPGVYSVLALWEGDDVYTGSESVMENITVKKLSSKIIIEASKEQINAGTNVTIFGALDPAVSDVLIEVSFVKPDSSMETFDTFTNVNGEFSVVSILDETRYYFVSASWQGNARFNGSSSKTLELEVIDYQHLKIIIKDLDGVLIEGASVASTTQPSGQPTLEGTTNLEGFVLFEKVMDGTYSFLVTLEGYESNTGSLAASPGDTSETTILLEKEVSQGGGGIPGFPLLSMLLALLFVVVILSRKK